MSDASPSPSRNSGNRTDRRGRGRLHQPTDASRKHAEALASFGVPHADIARIIGIGEVTLRKHYAEVLATAAVKANSMVAQSLFNKATRGDGAASVTAGIFWMRTRGRWREHDVHEVTGLNGGPIQMVDVSGLSDAQLAALQPVLSSLAVRREGQ